MLWLTCCIAVFSVVLLHLSEELVCSDVSYLKYICSIRPASSNLLPQGALDYNSHKPQPPQPYGRSRGGCISSVGDSRTAWDAMHICWEWSPVLSHVLHRTVVKIDPMQSVWMGWELQKGLSWFFLVCPPISTISSAHVALKNYASFGCQMDLWILG